MSQFHVLLAIDAVAIQKNIHPGADAEHPANVGQAHVSVMQSLDIGKTISGSGANNLNVEEYDEIFWWVHSPGPRYSCLIYNFVDLSGGGGISNDNGIFDQPVLMQSDGVIFSPNKIDPTSPTPKKITVSPWRADVQKTGSLTFGIQFMIFQQDGTFVGHYEWTGTASAND